MASQVPLEPKRDAQVVDEPDTVGRTKEASATPFTSSSGPGTTTFWSNRPFENFADVV